MLHLHLQLGEVVRGKRIEVGHFVLPGERVVAHLVSLRLHELLVLHAQEFFLTFHNHSHLLVLKQLHLDVGYWTLVGLKTVIVHFGLLGVSILRVDFGALRCCQSWGRLASLAEVLPLRAALRLLAARVPWASFTLFRIVRRQLLVAVGGDTQTVWARLINRLA